MTINTSTRNTSIRAVSEAYLAIAQDITQGLSMNSTVLLENSGAPCKQCLEAWHGGQPGDNRSDCEAQCVATMRNVRVQSKINFRANAFAGAQIKNDFATQVKNSIVTQTNEAGSNLNDTSDSNSSTTKIANITDSILSLMSDSTHQQIKQTLDGVQFIRLSGPGNVERIDFSAAVEYIGNVLLSDSQISSQINDLSDVIATMTDIIVAGNDETILWVVRIAILILWIVVVLYSTQIVFTIYSLWVT